MKTNFTEEEIAFFNDLIDCACENWGDLCNDENEYRVFNSLHRKITGEDYYSEEDIKAFNEYDEEKDKLEND